MEARNYSVLFPHFDPQTNNLLNELINCTIRREPFQTGDILLKNPELLTAIAAEFEDGFWNEEDEKRKFKSFSPLKYAAWSLDIPMLYWLVLHWALTFVSAHNLDKKETLAWMKSVREQAVTGIRYRMDDLKEFLVKMLKFVPVDKKSMLLNHISELNLQYDMQTLLQPLKACVEHYTKWSLDRRVAGWTMVAEAQCKTTWRVVHEYSHQHINGAFFADVEHDTLPRCDQLYLKENGLKYKNISGWNEQLQDKSLIKHGVVYETNDGSYNWNPKQNTLKYAVNFLSDNHSRLDNLYKNDRYQFENFKSLLGATPVLKEAPKKKK